MLADTGADLLTIKRHGGWKSNTVAEGYIETSLENKKKVANKILGGQQLSRSNDCSVSQSLEMTTTNSAEVTSSGISLTKCKNCVIKIYNK
jgi:hypothetical protein